LQHSKTTKKLGRTKSHREAMVKNMLRSFFTHERIRTTISKAKYVKRYAERLICFAQDKSVASNRILFQYLQDRKLVKYVVDEVGPRFKDYKGGFTRILKLGTRPGDSAEMALLEMVIKNPKHIEEKSKTTPAKKEAAKK
jgi:large subunit ribosomal protein L17